MLAKLQLIQGKNPYSLTELSEIGFSQETYFVTFVLVVNRKFVLIY